MGDVPTNAMDVCLLCPLRVCVVHPGGPDPWATVGLIRGAWLGLNGSSPRFTDLIDVNGAAVWRLFSRQVVLTVLVGVITCGFGTDDAAGFLKGG